MADTRKRGNTLQFIALFLALYLGIQLVFGSFFPAKDAAQQVVSGPRLTAASSFTIGTHPVITVENRAVSSQSMGIGGWISSKWCSLQRFFTSSPSARECAAKAVVYTGTPVTFPERCPKTPVDVFVVENPGTPQEKRTPKDSPDTVVPCEPVAPILPGESVNISLASWKYSIFEQVGTYEVRLPQEVLPGASANAASGSVIASYSTVRFEINEPGLFTKAFRTFISAPFLNFLILIASITPGYNLGVAIILLTLVVKLLLFFPTQHALEGQKKMQMLQPKIEALKARFKDDPKKLQEETMKLWKEHNINPFQSCLPMLIQFPILIGLFYVIRDGSDLALSQHLIYGPYQNLPWDFGTSFLGLNLLSPNVTVMPILLVVLQFLQMKLTFSIQKRKKKKQDVIDVPVAGKEVEKAPASAQDMQQKMMLYALPLMIGFFALQFPAAVSVYWGVSTLFGIGQQMIVNREHLRV